MVWSTAKQWIAVRHQGNLTGAQLEAFKSRRLQSLVRQAYRNVPFYRKLYDSVGFKPEEFCGLPDLKHLPIITKNDLLDNPAQDLVATDIDPDNCLHTKTGGTSGTLINVIASRPSRQHETMVWLRSWAKNGLRLTDRQVTVKDVGEVIYPDAKKTTFYQRFGLFRIKYLSMYDQPDYLVREIKSGRPDILRGPPSILQIIAEQAGAASIRPRMLFTTSESLTESTRKLLESTFCAPVHDLYGATEAGCIAWQNPATGTYIVNSDSVIVEVINEGRPGVPRELGDVVITNLFADAMPFIRYKLGDTCEVGERSPSADSPDVLSIQRVLGRSLIPIVLADGSKVTPYLFMVDDVTGVREYHVAQESPGLVKILVVKKANFSEQEMVLSLRDMQDHAGPECQIVVDYVDYIPTSS